MNNKSYKLRYAEAQLRPFTPFALYHQELKDFYFKRNDERVDIWELFAEGHKIQDVLRDKVPGLSKILISSVPEEKRSLYEN